MRDAIHTDQAATSRHPLSQAVRAGGLLFCSGQGPLDVETGEVVGGTIQEQTARTLENLAAVLAAAGCTLDDVVKVNGFLRHREDVVGFNEAYVAAFAAPRPARATVVVADLLADILVELDAVAVLPEGSG